MTREAANATPSRARKILRALERMFAIIGVLLVLYHVFFHVSVISSGSMSPTLQGTGMMNGDTVLTEKLTLRLRPPRRWEVVLYEDSEFGAQVMKRVVALPGEKISLPDPKTMLINGKPIGRPRSLESLKYYAYGNLQNGKSFSCVDDYYLLGDDSKDSQDSRYIGALPRGAFHGRAWLRIWPPSRMGFVNP